MSFETRSGALSGASGHAIAARGGYEADCARTHRVVGKVVNQFFAPRFGIRCGHSWTAPAFPRSTRLRDGGASPRRPGSAAAQHRRAETQRPVHRNSRHQPAAAIGSTPRARRTPPGAAFDHQAPLRQFNSTRHPPISLCDQRHSLHPPHTSGPRPLRPTRHAPRGPPSSPISATARC